MKTTAGSANKPGFVDWDTGRRSGGFARAGRSLLGGLARRENGQGLEGRGLAGGSRLEVALLVCARSVIACVREHVLLYSCTVRCVLVIVLCAVVCVLPAVLAAAGCGRVLVLGLRLGRGLYVHSGALARARVGAWCLCDPSRAAGAPRASGQPFS